MKIVIAAIVGIAIVGFAIGYFISSDTQYEIIEKETSHPCQEITLEVFLILTKLEKIDRSSLLLKQLIALNEEYEKKVVEIEQLLIENNCENTKSEWATDEFQDKMQFLVDNGFLP